MDVNLFRILVTLASFAAFAGIVAWAWSRRRDSAFDEAAALPLADSVWPADAAASPADAGRRAPAQTGGRHV